MTMHKEGSTHIRIKEQAVPKLTPEQKDEHLEYEIKINVISEIQSSLIEIQRKITAVHNATNDLRDHCNEVVDDALNGEGETEDGTL